MRRRFAMFSFAAFLLLTSATSCSSIYEFSGIVIDGDGQPIAGAKFAIEPHDWEKPKVFDPRETSAGDGTFKVRRNSAIDVELFRFITRCDGYLDDDRIVLARAKDLRIVLARVPKMDE